MFCEQCGKEIPPGNAFCPECGAPVKTAAETPPVAAAPGPIPSPGGKPAKGSRRGLIALIASVIGVLVIAAVVLVLVFVVFKGDSGPQVVVGKFLEAVESGDVAAVMGTVDSAESSLEEALKENLIGGLPDDARLTDLSYEVQTEGDEATVTAKGTLLYTGELGEEESGDLAEGGIPETYLLVKKEGKWLISSDSFSSTWASMYMEKGDEYWQETKDLTMEMMLEVIDLETALSEVTTVSEYDAAVGPIEAMADDVLENADRTASEYRKIDELSGVDDYKEYADIMLEAIDTGEEAIAITLRMLKTARDIMSAVEQGQPIDDATIMSSLEQDAQEVEDLGAELDELEMEALELKNDKDL